MLELVRRAGECLHEVNLLSAGVAVVHLNLVGQALGLLNRLQKRDVGLLIV